MIEQLSTSMGAPEFVNKLNMNIAEAAASGSGSGGGGDVSTISRTLHLQMQGGRMTNGYIVPNTESSNDNNFKRYCHTVLMLGIENCTITNVAVESGETLTIFCYGGDGAYLSSVSSVSNIPALACYVKFMVNKSSAYTGLRQLEVTISGKPTFCKNDTPEHVTNQTFSFEVSMPAMSETSLDGVSSYIGSNNGTRYYDNGYVKLPPNYTRDGAPVPLVVYVHGTNGLNFTASQETTSTYYKINSFLANNGYAVCDCSGLTNAYKANANAFYAPTYLASIASLVKFIMANYNVKTDGIYVYGKSSGGYMVHLLTQMQGIKIKAAGSLAPALSPLANMPHYATTYLASVNMVLSQLSISNISGWSDADKTTVLDNIHKLREIDAFYTSVDLSDDEVRQITSDAYTANNRNLAAVSACMAKLGTARRWVYCPTKIWIAMDDASVYYDMANLYVQMAQRSGSPCYLRTIPRGTGGHKAVDNTEYAATVNYTTKYGGDAIVAIAVAELLDWFNRW